MPRMPIVRFTGWSQPGSAASSRSCISAWVGRFGSPVSMSDIAEPAAVASRPNPLQQTARPATTQVMIRDGFLPRLLKMARATTPAARSTPITKPKMEPINPPMAALPSIAVPAYSSSVTSWVAVIMGIDTPMEMTWSTA